MAKVVYIGACGLGLGHIGRMLPVAETLREEGVDVVFSTYGKAYHLAKSRGFRTYLSPEMFWPDDESGYFNPSKGLCLTTYLGMKAIRQTIRERKYIRKVKPDLAISDTRYSTLVAMWQSDAPTIFVTTTLRFPIPDLGSKKLQDGLEELTARFNYRFIESESVTDVLIPDLPKPDTICADCLDVPARIDAQLNYTGFITRKSPAKDVDCLAVRKSLGFAGNGSRPFIFAPVSGPGRSRERLGDAIARSLKGYDADVLLTYGRPESTFESTSGNIRMLGWVENREELLSACDVIISRPGMGSLSDILSSRKPSILIPTPLQPEQEVNARRMESLGLSVVIPQDELSPDSLRQAVEEVFESESINARLSYMGQQMDKNNGLERTVEVILERIGK